MARLALRQADRGDERMIFEWRNDPWIVERGISGNTVTWDEHRLWFDKALQSPDVNLFIVEHDSRPIGQVRFQRSGSEEAEITVYLTKEHTGQGLGVEAIRQGCAAAFENWKIRRIFARVLSDNAASFSAFAKAGFRSSHELCDDHSIMMIDRD